MSDLASRLSALLAQKNISMNAFAKRIGVSQRAISKIINGETRDPKNILEIATALGVDPNWLKTGVADANIESPSFHLENHSLFKIDLYDYELSAGGGIVNLEYPDIVASILFTQDGLERVVGRKNSKGVCMFKVPTDSMMPTISPKDLVFIDTNINSYVGEGIYAFRLNGEDYIKRLQRLPTGVFRALSDNKLYEPFDITEEFFDSAEIIGKFIRVVPVEPREL